MTAREAREILKLRYPESKYIVVQHSYIYSKNVGDIEHREVYTEEKGWSVVNENTSFEDAVDALIKKKL